MKSSFYLLIILLIPVSLLAQNSSARSWLLKGNAGTDTSINFLGTIDAKPLVFKVHKLRSGYIDFDSAIANTSFGYQALQINTSIYNAAMGYRALSVNLGGQYNAAFGANALASNTYGLGNTGIGAYSLFENNTGSFNTAIGEDAMFSTTSGSNNVGIGNQVLVKNIFGSNNVAIGSLAMNFSNASDNTAVGANVLYDNTTGNNNAGYGEYSLFINTTGNSNTAIGNGALFGSLTGDNNTAVGLGALFQNSTGSNNTALGYNSNVTEGDLINATMIGYNAVADASNKVRIGNSDVSSIGGIVNWSNYLPDEAKMDIKENVPGLKFIKALRPVTYDLGTLTARQPGITDGSLRAKAEKFLKIDGKISAAQARANAVTKQMKITGLIASEVDSVANKIHYDFSGIDKQGTNWGLRYAEFVVPLIKAVQELSKKNEEDDKKIDKLEDRNTLLTEEVNLLFFEVDELKDCMNKNFNCGLSSHLNQHNPNESETGSSARLEQNVPNPFAGNTTVSYYLPYNNSNAYINFFSLNGTRVKTIPITNTGKGSIKVNLSDLPAGTIQYSLVNDNKIVDSKKMVQLK